MFLYFNKLLRTFDIIIIIARAVLENSFNSQANYFA
jgi:hypothetical protein